MEQLYTNVFWWLELSTAATYITKYKILPFMKFSHTHTHTQRKGEGEKEEGKAKNGKGEREREGGREGEREGRETPIQCYTSTTHACMNTWCVCVCVCACTPNPKHTSGKRDAL